MLQNNDENLFGKEFRDHLTESVKSKKSSKEVFLKLDDSKKPFRSCPSFQQQQHKSRGQKQIAKIIEAIKQNKIEAGAGKTRNFKAVAGDFKVKAPPTHLFLDTSPVIRNIELVNVHPLMKRLFSKEMLTKAVDIPPAGRINHSLVNWQKLTLNQNILSVVKGYRIRFIKIPSQRKISKFYKDEQEANCSCGFGIKGDVEERGNNENSTCSRGVFEQLIPYGEKRRRLSPCDKSKNVEPVHSFSPFQNGRPFSVKAHNTGGRLDVQTGPEGCILQCPIRSKLEKVRKVSVEWDSLRVHVPVFWTRPSTKGIYKAIEAIPPEKDQY